MARSSVDFFDLAQTSFPGVTLELDLASAQMESVETDGTRDVSNSYNHERTAIT
jgi:hypothetical protein